MRIWTCTFEGRYVAACAVITAANEMEAHLLMRETLKEEELYHNQKLELVELDLSWPEATILLNGDY